MEPMDLPQGASPRDLAIQLAAGVQPPDSAFDQYLPADLRARSGHHWTPLHVIGRAMRWLRAAGARSMVDIGSGPGKFCVAAALSAGLDCVGVEERPRLVTAARDLARTFGVQDKVRFIESAFDGSQVPAADVYYLYNPFGENIHGDEDRVDDDVERSAARYERDVCELTRFLKSLPPATLVLTYHGFGKPMPRTFDEVHTDSHIPALLRLWKKSERDR